jgi:hypothetical protein
LDELCTNDLEPKPNRDSAFVRDNTLHTRSSRSTTRDSSAAQASRQSTNMIFVMKERNYGASRAELHYEQWSKGHVGRVVSSL